MIEICWEYLSLWCLWLYVIIMSRTSLGVNQCSRVLLNVKEYLAWRTRFTWRLSESKEIQTQKHLIRKKNPTIEPDWPNDWAMLRVLIWTMHLTVCYYYVPYKFQSESAFYNLPEFQETPCSKHVPYLKLKWQRRDSNQKSLSM